jgi:hypothetical protein
MKKLTTKWKIFLAASYSQLIISFLALVGIIVSMLNSFKASSPMPGTVYIFVIIFLIVCINSLLNIHISNRYLPDIPLAPRLHRFLNAMRMLMILLTALLLFFGIMTAYYVSRMDSRLINWRYVTMVIVPNLLFILCLYTTVMQFQIVKYLRRGNAGKINSLIDSIGT